MATNASSQPPQLVPPPRHSRIIRCIAILLLALIVLVGLAVLITWLIIRPKRLVYTIEQGSIHNYSLTNNHLNSTFAFLIMAYNPNDKISIYHDTIETSVAYGGQTVAFNTVEPFFQHRHNETRLPVKLVAQAVALSSSTSRDLRLERASGTIEVDVRIKSRIRYKVGLWKTKDRTLRVLCSPVQVHFSLSKHFERTFCELDF